MAENTAKLAEIVTATQLAFNAGSKKGVRVGDRVTLYRIVKITDPATKEPLGTVRVPRLVLKVNLVQDQFCIADVISTDVDNPSASNIPGFGRPLKVTISEGQTRSGSVLVKIGEEADIRSEESSS